jgi:predicted Zn-dependent peptidase
MGRASRFYERLVRERRVAKSVVTYAFPLLTGASMLLVWATGFPDSDPDALEAAMSEEVDALTSVQQREVDRAIALTETDLVRMLERVAERADLLSMFELYFDDPGRINSELDRLRAVSLDQIRGFVGERLVPTNRAVLTYVPEAGR